MSRCAGIEIGNRRARVAILDGSAKQYHLVEFFDEEFAGDTDAERAALLRDFLRGIFIRKENQGIDAVTSIDARNVTLREISIPYTREDHIERTLRFEAESYLHSQAIEEVVTEYLKVSESGGSSRLILCAAPKPVLTEHFALLRDCKIDPVVVELDVTALASAFSNTPLFNKEQTVLLIRMETAHTSLVLLENGKVVKIRSFWNRGAIQQPERLLEQTGRGINLPEADAAGGADAPRMGANSPAAGGAPAATATAAPPATHSAAAKPSSIEQRFAEIERALSILDAPESGARSESHSQFSEATLGGSLISPDGEDDVPICVVPEEEYQRLLSAELAAETAATGANSAPAAAGKGAAALALAKETNPVERLIIEIERTFAAYALTGNIDLMVVTGDQGAKLDVAKKLSDHFETEAVSFEFGDAFPITWRGDRADLNRDGVVAVGLALRALSRGISRFDLRKDEFRFERRFQQVMPSLALCALLAFSFVFMWSLEAYWDSRRLDSENAELTRYGREMYLKFFGEEAPEKATQRPIHAMQDKLRELKGKGQGKTKLIGYVSVVDMWIDVSDAIRRARVEVGGKPESIYPEFLEFQFYPKRDDNSGLKMKLRIRSQEEHAALLKALNDSKMFTVNKSNTKPEAKTEYLEATYELKFTKEFLQK